jgi:hypothetical protein
MLDASTKMESRAAAMDRLRREGRWNEATLFREQKRLQFRAEGMKRTAAVEAAWAAMMTEFPPLPVAPVELTDPEEPEMVDAEALELLLSRDSTSDLIDDVAWVYDVVGDDEIDPRDAPSLGAWSLLRWAQHHRSKFYEQIWPKVAAARAKRTESNPWDAAERERIEGLRRQVEEMQQEWRRKFVGDPPAVIHSMAVNALRDVRVDVDRGVARALGDALLELTNRCLASASERYAKLIP